MKRVPQKERVLKYIADFGSITTLEAVIDLQILRLASRIYDLKKAGYEIKGETVAAKNRYGEPTHYSRYSIGGV